MWFEKPFAGTVVAPNANVRFAVGGTPHSGAVFAKEVEFDPDVKYTLRPFSNWDQVVPLDPTKDSDCDGSPDALEVQAGLNPADPSDGDVDLDGDQVPNKDELLLGGDPHLFDSDGDSISDTVGLIAFTDFDGDGVAYVSDNCPDDANPGQQDGDLDDVGDVCDPTPYGTEEEMSFARLAVYRSDSGDSALAPPGPSDTRRARTDLKGLYQTDATVLVFALRRKSGRGFLKDSGMMA